MGKAKKAGAVGKSRVNGVQSDSSGVSFRVQSLDPLEKCGPGTSVQRLHRVDEHSSGRREAVRRHLVFFDRHGWYCEHGPNCPAVKRARAFGDDPASVRPARETQTHGPTHNGRMRA